MSRTTKPYEPYTFADREQRMICKEILQPLFERYGVRTREQRYDLKCALALACPYSAGTVGRRIFEDVFARMMNNQSVLLADEPAPKEQAPEGPEQISLF